MTRYIKIQGDTYECTLICTDSETLYPTFELTTITKGQKNKYSITSKICGINECTENGLHFGHGSSECINDVDENGDMYSNEYTLIDEAISDLFYDLTAQ